MEELLELVLEDAMVLSIVGSDFVCCVVGGRRVSLVTELRAQSLQ